MNREFKSVAAHALGVTNQEREAVNKRNGGSVVVLFTLVTPSERTVSSSSQDWFRPSVHPALLPPRVPLWLQG